MLKLQYILIALGFTVLLSSPAWAKHLHLEKYYQEKWCADKSGQVEVVFPDRTRCDCLTQSHAFEFDFGSKWAEAIGQSLYYSIQTGKKGGIALILEKPLKKIGTMIKMSVTTKNCLNSRF